MIAYIFILSMLAYTPLINFSSELNYAIALSIAAFPVFLTKRRANFDLPTINYYLILLSIFLVNLAFGHETNFPWFFNHVAFILVGFIVAVIYSNASDNDVVEWQVILGRFNDFLCVTVVFSMGVLFLYSDGLVDFVGGNYNGAMWALTEILGWPKAQLTAITGYCLIWALMTKHKSISVLFIIFSLPILLAGRSVAVALFAVLVFVYIGGYIFRYKILWIQAPLLIAVAWMAFLLVEVEVPSALEFDRAANFMVSIDLANKHFFGHGNGAYHWYVEKNQAALDAKYSYLFSPYQVEVFLGPESMINHMLGSFGYLLSSIFFILQALTLYWAYKCYAKVNQFEKTIILFWFLTFVSGIGQTSIMMGFPYFVVWALVIAIYVRCERSKHIECLPVHASNALC